MATSTLGEMFDDRLDDIQNQIDHLKEQVGNALGPSTTAPVNTRIITHRGSPLEEENKPTSNARGIPDSEGFWRDIDGDVWVCDVAGNTRLISKGYKQGDDEIYNQSLNFSSDFNLHGCGPYVKIDNPSIQSEDNAD